MTPDADRVKGCKRLRADWLTHLRVAIEDVDTVARDMMRKPTERVMGPARHREVYQGAAGKLARLLANPPPDPDEQGHDSNLRAATIAEMAAGHERQRAEDVAGLEADR